MKQQYGQPARNRKVRPPKFVLQVLRQDQIPEKNPNCLLEVLRQDQIPQKNPKFLLRVLRQDQIPQKTYVGRHVKKLTKNEQKFLKKLMLVDTSNN